MTLKETLENQFAEEWYIDFAMLLSAAFSFSIYPSEKSLHLVKVRSVKLWLVSLDWRSLGVKPGNLEPSQRDLFDAAFAYAELWGGAVYHQKPINDCGLWLSLEQSLAGAAAMVGI